MYHLENFFVLFEITQSSLLIKQGKKKEERNVPKQTNLSSKTSTKFLIFWYRVYYAALVLTMQLTLTWNS